METPDQTHRVITVLALVHSVSVDREMGCERFRCDLGESDDPDVGRPGKLRRFPCWLG
jgi:hypothetical protein